MIIINYIRGNYIQWLQIITFEVNTNNYNSLKIISFNDYKYLQLISFDDYDLLKIISFEILQLIINIFIRE